MNLTPLLFVGIVALGASCVSGLVGAGGGVIMIPALFYLFPPLTGSALDLHIITSLSLVQGIAAGVGGGYQHWRGERLKGKLLASFGPFVAVGGVLGALAAAKSSSHVLLVAFAFVTTAATILVWADPGVVALDNPRLRAIFASALFLFVGCIGGLVGVGAGFLTAPVLTYGLGVDVRTASSTALLLTLVLCVPCLSDEARDRANSLDTVLDYCF